MLLKCFIKPQW